MITLIKRIFWRLKLKIAKNRSGYSGAVKKDKI